MAGPETNVAEITPLIGRYATGDHSVGDRIFELLKPRLNHMAGVYTNRSRLSEDDLKSAAYEGMVIGLHNVKMDVGQPHEYLCRSAWWNLIKAIRKNDRWGKHGCYLRPADVSLDGVRGIDNEEDPLHNGRDAKQILDVLSTTDEYDLNNKTWWLKYCRNADDIKCTRLYLLLGTYEAVADVMGVTKQAISHRFKKMAERARMIGHDYKSRDF